MAMGSQVAAPSAAEQSMETLIRGLGLRIEPREFVEILTEELAGLRAAPRDADSRRALTSLEDARLRSAGFRLDPLTREDPDPIARTAASFAALIAASLTAAEAAQRLRVDPSRIRQLLGAGAIYGIKVRGTWHLPRFQFRGRRLVPGIDAVTRRLPRDLHPVEVSSWFGSPNQDLEVDGSARSPLEWLTSGGDPERAAALAQDL